MPMSPLKTFYPYKNSKLRQFSTSTCFLHFCDASNLSRTLRWCIENMCWQDFWSFFPAQRVFTFAESPVISNLNCCQGSESCPRGSGQSDCKSPLMFKAIGGLNGITGAISFPKCPKVARSSQKLTCLKYTGYYDVFKSVSSFDALKT